MATITHAWDGCADEEELKKVLGLVEKKSLTKYDENDLVSIPVKVLLKLTELESERNYTKDLEESLTELFMKVNSLEECFARFEMRQLKIDG